MLKKIGEASYCVVALSQENAEELCSLQLANPIVGALVIAVAHVPFAREVLLQLRVQAQLFKFLPPRILKLPGAPTSGTKIIFSPPAFQKALYVYIWEEGEELTREAAALKQRLRRSWRRKVVFAVLGLSVALAVLYEGWRPWVS